MILNVKEVYEFNDLVYTCWGGAVDTLDTIREHDKEDELLELVNSLLESYDGGLDRTALNDYLWFDRDDIYDSLGIDTGE